jgi:hypothetical protein
MSPGSTRAGFLSSTLACVSSGSTISVSTVGEVRVWAPSTASAQVSAALLVRFPSAAVLVATSATRVVNTSTTTSSPEPGALA